MHSQMDELVENTNAILVNIQTYLNSLRSVADRNVNQYPFHKNMRTYRAMNKIVISLTNLKQLHHGSMEQEA